MLTKSIMSGISITLTYISIVLLLSFGIMLIWLEGSMRSIIGLLLISMSIIIYIMSKGFVLLPLLLGLSVFSISIIFWVLRYISYNSYIYDSNRSILPICILYSLISINSSGMNRVPNMEMVSFLIFIESNIVVSLLIFLISIFIIFLLTFLNTAKIDYTFKSISKSYYLIYVMNLQILVSIALMVSLIYCTTTR